MAPLPVLMLALLASPATAIRKRQRADGGMIKGGVAHKADSSHNGTLQSPKLTLMTFNLQIYVQKCRLLPVTEGLTSLTDYYNKEDYKDRFSELTVKIQVLKSAAYFDFDCVHEGKRALESLVKSIGTDVVLMQEAAFASPLDLSPVFNMAANAGAEMTSWNVQLANQVAVRENVFVVQNEGFLTKSGHPERAAACARIVVQTVDVPIDVCSIHTVGGRFDDPKFKEFLQERQNEVQKVMGKKDDGVPMVIAGDFNAQFDRATAEAGIGFYISNILKLSQADQEAFYQYTTGVHEYFANLGWEPAYTPGTLGLTTGEGSGPWTGTSIFGSIVDWVYLSPDFQELTHLAVKSATTVPALDITDHNGVLVTFE